MKKRILTVALVVALLATCFGGTLAYLKDSDAQTNTFTTGNVLISLDEAKVEKDEATGNLVAKKDAEGEVERTTADQEYKLFPAMTVTKDPTITLDAGSENAWIAAKITVSNGFDLMTHATKTGALFDGTANVVVDGNVLYVYVKAVQSADAKIVLFNELNIPETWGNTEMAAINGMTINVEAYAVQANGFATCEAAMKAAFPAAFN